MNLHSFMGYFFANLCKREHRQSFTTISDEYLIKTTPQ
ncbi:hypothetical protein SACIG1213_2760 [Staphylococcus aureus subsp. aureus CIG1213]|nr:hypothetical protein SACIG1750_0033 [Staphylococcus aureus subsp. aureus CIG1750]EHT53597.1 hypothetical protein SACIG1213_2760 [Staphylococcus aureus subsp. aureus CIG1213]